MDIHSLSITKIKSEMSNLNINQYTEFIPLLKEDPRAGVQQYSVILQNKYNAFIQEQQRIKQLKSYEATLFHQGYQYIAGMDEVGRGPLAGPVVSCAVILPADSSILYINDSKKLSSSKRGELAEQIKKDALSIGIGIIEKDTIDEINIYQATKQSMIDAIDNLHLSPEFVLIDAMYIETLIIPQKSIPKGDEKCYSIAAASIVAKVTRDKMMDTYHEMYPQYNFKSNKGYGSQEHIDAIHKYGICPLHRMSFLNNILKVAEEK